MAEEFIRKDELANEITRPELLRNQPYYRQKGKRFTENMAGYAMLAKPGPPEAWMDTLPDVQRLDKAQLVMLIEEELIPREGFTAARITLYQDWVRRLAGWFIWDEAPGTKLQVPSE